MTTLCIACQCVDGYMLCVMCKGSRVQISWTFGFESSAERVAVVGDDGDAMLFLLLLLLGCEARITCENKQHEHA